jgi:enoyl-CoA hydratase
MTTEIGYETLTFTVQNGVAWVALNRPRESNALNEPLWNELRAAFQHVDRTPEIRVAILTGNGKNFCAGADVGMLAAVLGEGSSDTSCEGRTRESLYHFVLDLQDVMTTIERCRKPVIAAMHGASVGGGVDLAVACDLRYSTVDARFAVKEIDMAITGDVGVLHRLPRIIGEGMTRELAYTGRMISGEEARRIGLVNECFDTRESLIKGATDVAHTIAAKSPLAIRGTKHAITYGRDHSTADALDQVAIWNAAVLLSRDFEDAIAAFRQRREPKFED